MHQSTEIKIKCPACGTSQISHALLLFSDVMDSTIGRIGNKFVQLFHTDKFRTFENWVEALLLNLMEFFHLIRFSDDVSKACTGRSELIWREAIKRGIKMQQLVIFGKPIEQYRSVVNGKRINFQSLPIPQHLPQTGYQWLDDKYSLYKALTKAGINSPRAQKVSSQYDARKAFENMRKPVIIKPRNGSRGRHTTTNINTLEELRAAVRTASQITFSTVMQEHLFGSVYRATVINNELVGFFRADPPKVTGDGVHTISQLIEEKDRTRPEKISEVKINADLLSFIGRQGYTLDSILEKDKTIDLTAKTGRFYGGYTEEMLPKIHPRLREIFKKAGEVVQAPVVGFDLIIEDPTKDPAEQRWGIIECNSMPFIDLHYFALVGKPINLAENVWDLWN